VIKLSIGAPPVQKVAGAAFGVVFALAGLAFVLLPLIADGWLQSVITADESCPSPSEIAGIPYDLLPPAVQDCVSGGSAFLGFDDQFGPMRWISLLGIPFTLVGLYLALSSVRTAGWLDGTRATVRRAFRARTVDLATATVTAGSYSLRRNRETSRETLERFPTLTARDPESGRTITIPLHLPSSELNALAQAIRDPALATQLRTLASTP
jgi:hypothetical protein